MAAGENSIISLGIELVGRQRFEQELKFVQIAYARAAADMGRVQLGTSVGGGGQKFLPGTGYIGGGVGGFQQLLGGPETGPYYKRGGVSTYRPP